MHLLIKPLFELGEDPIHSMVLVGVLDLQNGGAVGRSVVSLRG